MARFLSVGSTEHINLDLVRRITEDVNGNITLHFDSVYTIVLKGEDAQQFRNEFDGLIGCGVRISD
jgi:hypothetical protein